MVGVATGPLLLDLGLLVADERVEGLHQRHEAEAEAPTRGVGLDPRKRERQLGGVPLAVHRRPGAHDEREAA
jgi:hypothetical protein